MWKIFIVYDDKSKLTITGKHPDIPLLLALKYRKEYVSWRSCAATYQQYPKKNHPSIPLGEKIAKLEAFENWHLTE